MKLYENIRARRIALKMTQQELATKLGYRSTSTITKIEAGENDIPQSKIEAFAKALKTTPGNLTGYEKDAPTPRHVKSVRIPILGKVVASVPLEAAENIEGYEEIAPSIAQKGEYFALRVRGKSMEPFIIEDDIVIARKQKEVESGEIAIVLVNGDEATVKEIKIYEDGLMLIGKNVAVYSPRFYNLHEIKTLPVKIIGKVVEVRRSL